MLSRARVLVDDPRTTVVLLVVAVLLTGSSILSITIVDDASTVAATTAPTGDGGDVGAGTNANARSGAATRPSAQRAPAGAEGEPVEPVGATSTTTAVVEPGEQPVEADPELSVTRPGSYRERITTTTADGEEDTEEVTLIVERIGGAGDVRLRHRRESDGRDIGATQELAWRPDGVYVLSTNLGAGGFEIHCEHDPPLLQSPRRLEPGATWQGEDSCTFDTAGGGTIHFRYEATVREAVTIVVAGTQLVTWVIDTVTDVDVTTSSFGDFRQHSEGPVWVDPTRGLTVRSDEDFTFTGDDANGGGAQHSHVVRELLTLDPV